jgi:small subunit ribosomal protein S20
MRRFLGSGATSEQRSAPPNIVDKGSTKVANHPQAEKRNRQRIKRQAHHRHYKTTMRSYIKRVRSALAKKEQAVAREALKVAIPFIDRCAVKGIIPKKRASRFVSRLTQAVNALSS